MSKLILPATYDKPDNRQRLRAKYDAAQTVRNNQNHWANADSLSAAAANSPDVRQKLRDRSRYECSNNTYAAGMLSTLANDTIGTGPTLRMQTGSLEVDSAIEYAFHAWTSATRFDQKLRVMRMARARDGEVFAMFATNRNLKDSVKLDIRLHESEEVAQSIFRSSTDNADGIIFDDFGNPIGYNLLRSHPGDTSTAYLSAESDVIPARDMLHIFLCERPGQIRGIPEITAALPLYAQLRRYTLAVIAAAETAADIAAYLKTQAGPEDPDDIEPLDTIDIEQRMIMTLPRGWDISQLRSEQPATTYGMFKREIINEIARCLNMPYNVAAGDSSSYNYASGRLDHKTYFKSIRVDRGFWTREVLEPTLSRWWEEARLVNGLLPLDMRTEMMPPLHDWAWDGDEHVDPLKEANAQSVRLKSLTTTLSDEYARQGKDWEEQLRQIAKEQELIRELGIETETTMADGGTQDDGE